VIIKKDKALDFLALLEKLKNLYFVNNPFLLPLPCDNLSET